MGKNAYSRGSLRYLVRFIKKTCSNIGTAVIANNILIATFGCNNELILSGARVYYSMTNDGLFFQKTAHLNKHAVPEFALQSYKAFIYPILPALYIAMGIAFCSLLIVYKPTYT